MADLFATDGILLVKEFQRRESDAAEDVLVIQRCCRSVVDGAIDCEVDMFEEEGLRAGFD